MFVSTVTDRGATPALVSSAAFHQARLAVTAENVANMNTPGYRTKHLDVGGFQRALRTALDRRHRDPEAPWTVRSGTEVRTGADGSLRITPSELPAEQVLFQDGTNLSIEREMAELAKTRMWHEASVGLLRSRMEGLRKAIRGRL